MRSNKRHTLPILILLFGIIFSLVSIPNHYYFRTAALDLGAYTNALYDYIHLQWNDSTTFLPEPQNLLADHFDIYLILFSPFILIFKTYTLLIIQIAALLMGGYGIFKYFNSCENLKKYKLHGMVYFFLFFGVYSALAFDYHSNVVAACIVPWFFLAIKQQKLLKATLLALLIILGKENMPLWMAFICLGLAFEYRKTSIIRNYLILGFLFCGFTFIIISQHIMPAFANSGELNNFKYAVIGGNLKDAIIHIISHPIDSLSVLFNNHNLKPEGDFVKAELHIFLLLSGLPLLMFKPQYIVMLIPIYFQKLFHDIPSMWGVFGQYCIEFTPILTIGSFKAISSFKSFHLKYSLPFLVLILTGIVSHKMMEKTYAFTKKENIRFYQKIHYTRDFDVKKTHLTLDEIPEEAIVSAQTQFVPHLALRDKIYQFPKIEDAEYIILSSVAKKTYPLNPQEYLNAIENIKENKNWDLIYDENELLIFEKVK